jgi:hypothetical protein
MSIGFLTVKTVHCLWDGDRMDCHMAVDAPMTYVHAPVDSQ